MTRLKDWKDRGFWSKNAVVNTQNNTESFQAGRSALALMNANTAKSVYAAVTADGIVENEGLEQAAAGGLLPLGGQLGQVGDAALDDAPVLPPPPFFVS